jgi:hypothetical protein
MVLFDFQDVERLNFYWETQEASGDAEAEYDREDSWQHRFQNIFFSTLLLFPTRTIEHDYLLYRHEHLSFLGLRLYFAAVLLCSVWLISRTIYQPAELTFPYITAAFNSLALAACIFMLLLTYKTKTWFIRHSEVILFGCSLLLHTAFIFGVADSALITYIPFLAVAYLAVSHRFFYFLYLNET